MNQRASIHNEFLRSAHPRGIASLEVLISLCVIGAAWFILRSLPESTSLIEAETTALSTMKRIVEAEETFYNLAETTPHRFAGMGELVGRADDVGWRLTAGSRFFHRHHTLISQGYCFRIYLSTDNDSAVLSFQEQVRRDFFLVYGWPLNHGSGGRRVFVAARDGTIRFWDNANGSFEGLDAIPPARLASPPTNTSWPLRDYRPKWYEVIRWRVAR